MNAKYFAALTTIILATGLSQPVTLANDVVVQRSPKSQSQQKASELPFPPDLGAPGGRKGGATRNVYILH